MSIDVKNEFNIERMRHISYTDLNINYCGNSCILREFENSEIEVIPLSAANAYYVAIKRENELYITLKDKRWTKDHLYGVEIARSIPSKIETMKLLVEKEHPALANIKGYCKCSYKMEYVNGKLLDMNIWGMGSSPNSSATVYQFRRFDEFLTAMKDLVGGLLHLHRIGLAHTDPIPTNVIVNDGGQPRWIDLDDSVKLTPLMQCLDVVVFYNFTWLSLLGQLEYIDMDLVRKVETVYQEASNETFFEAFYAVLDEYKTIDDLSVNTKKMLPIHIDEGDVNRDSVARTILTRAFAFYKITTTDSWVELKVLRNLLNAEVHRQTIFAREYEKTNLELRKWAEELESGKVWLEEQRANWESEAKRLAQETLALENRLHQETLALENRLRQETLTLENRLKLEMQEREKLKRIINSKWYKLGRALGLIKNN